MERKEIMMLDRFNVMPVKDKRPLISWANLIETKQSIADREKIINENGKGTIGVVCGKVSNLFVLDDDGSDELKNYAIPRTASVKTPRGGRHYYFRWTPDLDSKVTTRTAVLNKVDTRGDGGYVVWYGWDNPPNLVPFAAPPKWLIDKLPNKTNGRLIADKPTPSQVLDNVSEENHNRNASFASLAGSLRAKGCDAEFIYKTLLPKAREVNFPADELWNVCKSICRYEPNKPEAIVDESIVPISQVLSEQLRTEWLINPQLISRHSITFLAGLPEACKTWMLMDLALAAATGGEWLHRYPCAKSKVVYLDQERSRASTIERMNSLIAGRNLSSKDLNDTLLLKPQSRFKLNVRQSFDAFDRMLTSFKPELILVDSFKRIHSNNELSSQDMQALFTQLEALKDKHGCSFVFIHHETKGVIRQRSEKFEVRSTDAAGTIDLQQTAEHFFNAVETSAGGSTLYHTKNNLGAKVAPHLVKVIDVLPDKSKIVVEAY